MIPTNRKELVEWALRRLGAPVIEINVSEEQIEDRIDEGFLLWNNYNFDATEKMIYYHAITASNFTISQEYTQQTLPIFHKNDILHGKTSGAYAFIYDITTTDKAITENSKYNVIRFKYCKDKENNRISGDFIKGEEVELGDYTFNITSDITLGDIDLGYIQLPDKIISVTGIVERNDQNLWMPDSGMFSLDYQFRLQNMYNLYSFDIITYDIYKSYIETVHQLLYAQPRVNFNKGTGKLILNQKDLVVDKIYLIEAYATLNPSDFTKIYSDEMLRYLVYTLIKMQWGNNLKKYSGIKLPGDVTLDGQKIFDEAKEEFDALMNRLKTEFQEPPIPFLIG